MNIHTMDVFSLLKIKAVENQEIFMQMKYVAVVRLVRKMMKINCTILGGHYLHTTHFCHLVEHSSEE